MSSSVIFADAWESFPWGWEGDSSFLFHLHALPLQGAVEPMQIDVDPQEDQQNAPDINYVVENPTLVCA